MHAKAKPRPIPAIPPARDPVGLPREPNQGTRPTSPGFGVGSAFSRSVGLWVDGWSKLRARHLSGRSLAPACAAVTILSTSGKLTLIIMQVGHMARGGREMLPLVPRTLSGSAFHSKARLAAA
jgi:hypothetical protein